MATVRAGEEAPFMPGLLPSILPKMATKPGTLNEVIEQLQQKVRKMWLEKFRAKVASGNFRELSAREVERRNLEAEQYDAIEEVKRNRHKGKLNNPPRRVRRQAETYDEPTPGYSSSRYDDRGPQAYSDKPSDYHSVREHQYSTRFDPAGATPTFDHQHQRSYNDRTRRDY